MRRPRPARREACRPRRHRCHRRCSSTQRMARRSSLCHTARRRWRASCSTCWDDWRPSHNPPRMRLRLLRPSCRGLLRTSLPQRLPAPTRAHSGPVGKREGLAWAAARSHRGEEPEPPRTRQHARAGGRAKGLGRSNCDEPPPPHSPCSSRGELRRECGMRMPVGGARLGVRHYVGLQEVASRGSSAASPASDKPAERRRAQVLMHRFV